MRIREGVLRDILRLVIWFPFRWMIRVAPVSTGFSLYKAAGTLHVRASRGKPERIASNLRKLLGLEHAAAESAAKRFFQNHYVDRLHIFLYPKLTTWETLAPFIEFENREILDAEIGRGKGVLLVQPHFGPVQITLLSLGLLGYRPLQIGYPSDEGLSLIGRAVAYRLRLKYEAMLPAPIIGADGYLGAVYKHLVKGGVVLTTGDGAGGGVFLGEHRSFPFLGTERMMPLGPALWSLRTGAALLPTFIIPERHDRFRIVFEPPITAASGDKEQAKVEMTRQFVAVAERYIKRYPACWHFWDEM